MGMDPPLSPRLPVSPQPRHYPVYVSRHPILTPGTKFKWAGHNTRGVSSPISTAS